MKGFVSAFLAGCMLVGMSIAPTRGDDGPEHQTPEIRPIPLGVSGGNATGLPTLSCCSGTLGALVNVGGELHILSNNHILARSNWGKVGNPISQPGKVDTDCVVSRGEFVADLSDFEPINLPGENVVDAALARIRPGQVREDGFILDIGVPNVTPVTAFIGEQVKKSGRTTGLTTGEVAAINVAVNVEGYCPFCTICEEPYLVRFVGQIAFTPGTFSAGGDSGSLIVENVATAPRPVALLFAAGSGVTIGSPIGPVLEAFGATMVGMATDQAVDANATGGTATDEQALATALTIQARHQDAIMQIPGVVGLGIGRSDVTGRLVLRVFLAAETGEVRQRLPAVLEGMGIETVISGPVRAR